MSRGLDFWSRRKAQVEAEAREEARAADVEYLAAREVELAEKTDEELCEELGLPDPDTLKLGDDFRAFMGKAVPERLRRRALRRLWVSNPVLANIDGLVDYAEDYTDSAMVVPDMKTAYQVGKGMLAHIEEMARQAEALANPPVAEEEVAEVEFEVDVEEPEAEVALAEVAPDVADAAEETSDPVAAPRRRMRFQFENQTGVPA
ncbi:NACalpha-BTF3-like transcription factor [Roseovarius sp. MBR-51]